MNGSLLILTFALQYASALQLTRRALPGAAAAATAIGTQNALAAAKPVLVLGANGGTGLEHDSSVRDRHYAIEQITQVREVPAATAFFSLLKFPVLLRLAAITDVVDYVAQ